MSVMASHGALIMLPDDSDLVFRFDYSTDSDTPQINNKNWNWTHYGDEKPLISGGVGNFSNGGPYTDGSVTFNADNFTVSFDIGSVIGEGSVFSFGDWIDTSSFNITASGNSISLWDAKSNNMSEAINILTVNIDLTGADLTNIIVVNNQFGCAIYSGDTLLGSSATSIQNGEINGSFGVGNIFNGGPKMTGTLDNVALYSTSVPEPASASLALLGAFGLLLRRRR